MRSYTSASTATTTGTVDVAGPGVLPPSSPSGGVLGAGGVGGAPSGHRRPASDTAGRGPSAWARHAPLVAVTTLALGLNTWRLSANGLGNTYYAAAVRSMTASWHDFFFVSLDPGGYISVDKPPVALWIEALSARIFGFNSWSLLLPGAIAGAASVALLYVIVRRWFGGVAAATAALVLALTPINVAVDRVNLPEPYMILFLLVAAWATLRAFESGQWARWLALAGAFVGVAFNTKMLAAYIPGPAFVVAIAAAAPGVVAAIKRLAVFGAAVLAASLPWMLVVDWWPASDRPYVGGSTDNSVANLVFGYNGLHRVNGVGQSHSHRGGLFGGMGGVFGGQTGGLRMFSAAVGGQIAWLLPAAALCAVAGLWAYRHDRHRRAAIMLFAGWLAMYAAVFSYAQGTFHSYYTSAMAPGLAALVGVGGVALVRLALAERATGRGGWTLAGIAGVVVTVVVQAGIEGRAGSFYDWVLPLVVVLALAGVAVIAVAGVAVALTRWDRGLLAAGAAVTAFALVGLPAAWAVSETTNPVLNSTLPQAGPRGGVAGHTFGSAASNGDARLAAFLRADNKGETWDLATSSAQGASGLIAHYDVPVMALGGFMGSDPASTVDEIAHLVGEGRVRYFEVSGGVAGLVPRGFGFLPGLRGFGATPRLSFPGRTLGSLSRPNRVMLAFGLRHSSQIMLAVQEVCTPLTRASTAGRLPARYNGGIYDCAGKANALRSIADGRPTRQR